MSYYISLYRQPSSFASFLFAVSTIYGKFLSLVLLFATRSLDYSRFSLLSSVVSFATISHNLIRIYIFLGLVLKARLYYLGMVLRFVTRGSIFSFITSFITTISLVPLFVSLLQLNY